MEYEDLTKKIIGCAYTVFNRMSFGFLESVYEKCLMIELLKTGLQAMRQVQIEVRYEDTVVGEFVADILVEDTIIVEIKSVRALITAHEVQLVNYLTATQKPVGLLLNFGPTGVQVKRKVRELGHKPD